MRTIRFLLLFILLVPLKLSVAPLEPSYNRVGYKQRGEASYYAEQFHGRKTASGEKFDMNALTAAHPRIRFHSLLRVTNLRNNQSVIVRINDRGPYKDGRIIDLSKAAAAKIDMIRYGVAPVQLEVIYVETGPITDRERKENEERIRKQEEKGIRIGPTPQEPPAEPEKDRRSSILERIRRLLGKPKEKQESEQHTPPQQTETTEREMPAPPKQEQQPPVQENKPQPAPHASDRSADAATFAGINTYTLDGTIRYPEGFGVQIGSYNKLEAALQVGHHVEQTRLANVYIQTGWVGTVRIFRVLVGEGTPEQARELAAKLKAKGFNGFLKQHY